MNKNKKKVLFVQPILPHYRVPFFKEFNKIYDLDLFAEHDHLLKYPFNIKYSRNFKIFNFFTWQKNLLKINFSNYNLVIFNVNPKFLSTLIALIICKFKGIKTIDYNHRRSSTSNTIFIFIRNLIVKFLTNGRIYYLKSESDQAKNSKKIIFINPKNLGYANNSINTKLISKLRKKYIPKERSGFLFVGRLTSKSKIELLINALFYSEMNYKIHILGDLDDNNSYLQKLAYKYDVVNRIKWYKFSSNEEEISKLFNLCRCFVYPGEVGLSIIHAMSYGLPAIIHNNIKHHNPEHAAFTNEVNGLVFDENNPKSLSLVMDKLYSLSDIKLEEYSKNSLKTINEDFSIEKMVNNFHRSIRKILVN